MLSQLLCTQIEMALNVVLKTVDKNKQALLNDVLLEITFVGLNLSLFLHFVEDHVLVTPTFDGEPTLTIKGTPLAFCRLGLDKPRELSSQGALLFEGEITAAQTILDVFTSASIDWVPIVSSIIGDSAAHIVENVVSSTQTTAHSVINNVRDNMTDFLQEEIKILPPKEMVNDFCNDVDALVLDVERLKARVERLTAIEKKNP